MEINEGIEPRTSSKGVQFYRAFGAAKASPREQTQTQVNGGGIQRVNGFFKIKAKFFFVVKGAGSPDEALGEVMINSPVALAIGVSEGAVRNRAPNA